ncbi:MAG: proteasome subunit beta [Nanoarchaeota archaeon]|nr:proteasome subunit beta [Nanoarchaeota archaeon]
MEKEALKTGTTTIGIVCKDGIILAADKRTTAGYLLANRRQEKIAIISDDMAITHAGLVSDAQLLTKIIKAQLKLDEIRRGKGLSVREGANLLAGLLYGNIRKMSMIQSIVGFLLAGKDNSGFHLYDLGIDGSITNFEDFASTGSGSVMAFGVLETLYDKNITVADGIKLAVKAVNAAIQRDIASGNGIDVVTITSKGVQKVLTKELNTKLTI